MKKEREMIPSGIRTLAFPAFAVTAFGLGLGGLQGEILVNLDSTSLPEGPLETWLNSGTLDGDFTSAGSQTPTISIVDGVKAVQFVPGVANTHYVGPVAPESVVFNSSRTIEAWVHNPSPQEEETVFAWGRRGGP
ncbi:MAG: hypothetical protein LR011_00995, partial [Verrucomicrobia bacterium]|nr:hypothetical protein [Verrucomicrobiota bacterium]